MIGGDSTIMKKIALLAMLALISMVAPAAFAQNHGEAGVFADYTRLKAAGNINFFGVGGRVSFNVHEYAQLEAEGAYDFERNTTTTFTGPGATTLVRTGLRLTNFMFGPKLQTGAGPLRAFVTAKGGLLNFSVSGANAPAGFTAAVGQITTGDTNGVFYPGGGVEAYIGPIGIRLDVGDEIYFDNGANHNLKITLGPHIRF